jgi:hypothetical protein
MATGRPGADLPYRFELKISHGKMASCDKLVAKHAAVVVAPQSLSQIDAKIRRQTHHCKQANAYDPGAGAHVYSD